jgi:2-oxoglutarate/2-oxoacid ferredoxin oxidoreductase subunit alpha
LRDEKLSRPWAVPGKAGFEHRIGGLSKEHETGDVSYDPENNQKMVKIREEKVEKIAEYLPDQLIEAGDASGNVLVLGWGSTYGALLSAVKELLDENVRGISFTHLRFIRPLPKNLGSILSQFQHILIPELNNGQLIRIIREKYAVNTIGMNKIMGLPFTKTEIKEEVLKVLKEVNSEA